jgi:hypothetical protein
MMEGINERTTYCRKLGHYLAFTYCGREALGLPCKKIIDCWFESFNIQKYLKDNFQAHELAHLYAPPHAKMTTLVDLIKQARERIT